MHALRRQGWTISAIARHLGRDRKTIRTYLAGDREVGVRARTVPGPFEAFAPYCAQRLADDPHLWASTLFDELRDLGYAGSASKDRKTTAQCKHVRCHHDHHHRESDGKHPIGAHQRPP